jgi:hypothetical protein
MTPTLDLSLFSALTKKMQCKLPFGSGNGTVKFVQTALHSLKRSLIEDPLPNAFALGGFRCDIAEAFGVLLLRKHRLSRIHSLAKGTETELPPARGRTTAFFRSM